MSYYNGPRTVTDNLVFYIDAGNPKSYPGSGSTIYDLTEKGYNGSFQGSAAYSNGAIQCRYATQGWIYASFNEGVLKSDNTTGKWSYEVFFKNISAPNSAESFLIGRAGCHGGIYTYPNGSNTDVYHAIKTGSCWTGAVNYAIKTLAPNDICHSIMTYNNGVVKSYINGLYVGTDTLNYATYGMTGYDNTIYIGGFGNTTYYSNNCDIYIAKAYNRDLTAGEILQNYNAVRGRYNL